MVAPGFSYVGTLPDDASDQRVFSRIPRCPRPCITVLLLIHLTSPSSALETSTLRATQISQLHFQHWLYETETNSLLYTCHAVVANALGAPAGKHRFPIDDFCRGCRSAYRQQVTNVALRNVKVKALQPIDTDAFPNMANSLLLIVPDDAASWRVSSGFSRFSALAFWRCSIVTSLHPHRLTT
ncbi:hypothetical protein PR048_002932, partial [Dryococelus australis]